MGDVGRPKVVLVPVSNLPNALSADVILAVEAPASVASQDFERLVVWLRWLRGLPGGGRGVVVIVPPAFPLASIIWIRLKKVGARMLHPEHYNTDWSVEKKQEAIAELFVRLWARLDATLPKSKS